MLAADEQSLITELTGNVPILHQRWGFPGGSVRSALHLAGSCCLGLPVRRGGCPGRQQAMGSGGWHCSVHTFVKEPSLSDRPGAPLAAALPPHPGWPLLGTPDIPPTQAQPGATSTVCIPHHPSVLIQGTCWFTLRKKEIKREPSRCWITALTNNKCNRIKANKIATGW